jgi:hypothetical protein
MEEEKYETAYDVLTAARIHENGALVADKESWQPQKVFHLNELYRNYPQIVPYSAVQMAFRLELSEALQSAEQPEVQSLLDRLEDFNIEWNPPERETYPEVKLDLAENNTLSYQVMINREVFTQGTVDLSSPDAAKKLAYRLFKILR